MPRDKDPFAQSSTEAQLVFSFLDTLNASNFDREARERASDSLRALGTSRVFPLLEPLLKASDAEVRCDGVEAILRIDAQAGLETVLPLLDDPDWGVRYHTSGLLHEFGDWRAVTHLVERVRSDTDPQVRGSMAFALGGIGDVQALPALSEVEREDNEVDRLGYTPSHGARHAISDILMKVAIQHIEQNPELHFEEDRAGQIHLRGDIGSLIDITEYRRKKPSANFHYTVSGLEFGSKHVAPFSVRLHCGWSTGAVERTFVFSSHNGRWAIGIYISGGE